MQNSRKGFMGGNKWESGESILRSVAEVKCKQISDKITAKAKRGRQASKLIRKQMMEKVKAKPENKELGRATIWEMFLYDMLLKAQRRRKEAQEEEKNDAYKAVAQINKENPYSRGVNGEF
jgi:hypothetical protein